MRHFITAVVYVLCVSIIYMCVHSCFWILQCLCIALYSHYMCDAVPKCWKMLYLARIRRNLFLCKLSIACACLRAHVLAPVPDCIYTAEFFRWVVVHLSRGNKWLPIQSCAALPHISTVSKIWPTESLWHSWTKRKLSSEPCLQTNAAHFKCNTGTVPKLFALCPR